MTAVWPPELSCDVRDPGSSSRTIEFKVLLCKKCDLESRAGHKFCASCGAALPVFCPKCGFQNEDMERYCGGCGHLLANESGPANEAKRVDSEGDRRPVTVLFCDLVGYTHLSSVMDPEDVHALLERFFARTARSVSLPRASGAPNSATLRRRRCALQCLLLRR